jgi:L-lactate utilization protein LutB
VFRHIGGHTYHSTYSGPIGSIISPSVFGVDYAHLPFASTLCGKCNEVCPVRLNLTQLLIYRRKQLVQSKVATVHSNTKPFRRMQYFLRRRKRMDMFSSGLKNLVIRMKFKNSWEFIEKSQNFKKTVSIQLKSKKRINPFLKQPKRLIVALQHCQLVSFVFSPFSVFLAVFVYEKYLHRSTLR